MELNNFPHNTLIYQSESQNFKTLCAEIDESNTNLVVLGESGIGKTFLCHQLLHQYKNAIFIQGNSGTTINNFCKFVASNIGFGFSNGLESNELDLPNQLLQALMKIDESFLVIIDDSERLPGDTLATIMQFIQADSSMKCLLFGDKTLGEKVSALSIPGQAMKTVKLDQLDEPDTIEMLDQTFNIKLKKAQLNDLFQETQGNPKSIIEYIRKKRHLSRFNIRRSSLKANVLGQNLFFMLIGAILISGFYFSHLFIYKKPVMEPVRVLMDDIKPVEDFRPMVCYPDVQSSESMQATYEEPSAPLYVIQLLSVKNPSQLKSIEKPLKDFALKPAMIKNNQTHLYTLYLGPFFTHEDASLVLMNLPEEIKALNPWVRSSNALDNA